MATMWAIIVFIYHYGESLDFFDFLAFFMNKGKKDYFGVGGHLFAIALEESIRAGFGGVIIGHPSNRKLNEHYIEKLHAKPFNYGPLADGYQYTIILAGMDARYVYEKYNFESIDKIKK